MSATGQLRRRYLNVERLERRVTPTLGLVGPLTAADMALYRNSGVDLWTSQGGNNYSLAIDAWSARLAPAPELNSAGPSPKAPVIALPTPNGRIEFFQIWKADDMDPGLAAQFPGMMTFRGKSINQPGDQLVADVGPNGFHAKVAGQGALWYIDPVHAGQALYSVILPTPASAPDDIDNDMLIGNVNGGPSQGNPSGGFGGISPAFVSTGQTLRTFRLAVAATGEYYTLSGGSVAGTQANIVTLISRINLTLERDFCAHLTLIANNTSIIYSDAANDPYTGTDPFLMVNENQTNLDNVIGTANYDIGHVFSADPFGGGVGYLRAINAPWKAGGATKAPNTLSATSVAFEENVTHEMGHQFGAEHGFNGVNGAAAGNRVGQAAVEVGSGSSIMSYPGLCGTDDIQSTADLYYNSMSYDQVQDFLSTIPSIGTSTSTSNTPPTVSTGNDAAIPANTPFALTGTANDINADTLSYSWEERDLGVAQALGSPDNGFSPILRTFAPVSSPTRYFPNLTNLLAGTPSKGEQLPSTNRDLRFRLFVRDNRLGGGGVTMQDLTLNVVNTGSAFAVSSPNTAVSLPGGSSQMVTWNVAGTTAAPINTLLVNIKISTDGGLNYSTLVANTPNDGSEPVVLPTTTTSTARIKVEAVGNYFFDVSDVNFSITAAPAMRVSSIMPSAGSILTDSINVDVIFTQAVNNSSIGVNDLVLSQGIVIGAAPLVTVSGARYTIGSFTSDGPITITMPAGAVTSTTANPNAQFIANFTADINSAALPSFTAANPKGTLVYTGSVTGAVNSIGDVDQYTVNLDAGQTLSVVATPSANLQASIIVNGPGLSMNNSGNAGQIVALQSLVIANSGTYSIGIQGKNSSIGSYGLSLDLNAVAEVEPNDTTATAPTIMTSGMNLIDGSSKRYAFHGRNDAMTGGLPAEVEPNGTIGTASDATRSLSPYTGNLYQIGWKSFVGSQYFDIGQVQVSDIITGTSSGAASLRGTVTDPNLYFYTPPPPYGYYAGAGDNDGGPGTDAVVYRFSSNVTDTLYAGVFPSGLFTDSFQVGLLLENTSTPPLTGGNTTVVTAMNSDLNGAADLSNCWRPIQYRGLTAGSISSGDSDFYKYTFNAGDMVTFRAHSTSDMDVQINLRNSAGTIIAQDDGTDTYWTPDEDAALYAFVIPTTGTYYVEAKTKSGTGAYNLETLLSAATPPPALMSTLDYVSITPGLNGQVVVALKTQSPGNVSMDFVDASNNVLATAISGPTNFDKVLTYTALTNNPYYIRIQGDAGVDYVVTAVEGGTIDQEPNDSNAAAQPLTKGHVLGAVSGGNLDWYSFSANAGDLITLTTATPAGGSGEFVNTLDPFIELSAPGGSVIGSDDNSFGDGRNAKLYRIAPTTGVYQVNIRGFASTAGEYVLTETAVPDPPPTVSSVQINDGTSQRSRVTSLTVTLSELVTLPGSPATAFQLKRQSDNASPTLSVDLSGSTGTQTIAKLTFSGAATDNISLADGRYTLTIFASSVTDLSAGQQLDGDNNGTAGGNYVLIGDPASAPKLFRLYGDGDGSGLVDGVDFGLFRSSFNTSSLTFDFDNSGTVDGTDFGTFRSHFNTMI